MEGNMSTKEERDFTSGFFIVIAELVRAYDQPSVAESIIRANGMTGEDLTHMDEYDKVELRKLDLPLDGL
jgi:hypothetical protein